MSKTISDAAAKSPHYLERMFASLQTTLADFCHNSAGLVIGSSSKAKPKIANTVHAMIDGALVKKTTAEITLTTANNVANAKFNVIALLMNAAGTVTPTNGTAADTLAAVVFPAIPLDAVCVGYVIVNPTGTGGFVGGTTEFDDATVVPNAVFISCVGPFNPNTLSLPFAR